MSDEKGIIYNLHGTYFFKNQEGTQTGKIYMSPENNFIGDIIDTGNGYKNVPYLIYGNLTSEKLCFLKIPKDPYFSNVFWSLNNKNSNNRPLQYEGYFFILSSGSEQKTETVNSLERSIEFFKKNELDKVDSITKKLFEEMPDLEAYVEESLMIFPKNGSGEISLNIK